MVLITWSDYPSRRTIEDLISSRSVPRGWTLSAGGERGVAWRVGVGPVLTVCRCHNYRPPVSCFMAGDDPHYTEQFHC